MIWKIKPKADAAFFQHFPEYPRLISQLLYNRNLKTQKQIDEFFNPDYEADLHDPFLLKGMKKAEKRISKAVRKKEKIVIYGDYDADGICSAAILHSVLKELGNKNVSVYIPDRGNEGHGLNKNAVKYLAEKKTNLIITVDCGNSDSEEIKLAKSLHIDVVITDHHLIQDKSKAVALVDPFQKGETYPFKELAGAGVAYKVACALLDSSKKHKDSVLKKWLLDLVAIATVADMVPIIGENRTLVKYGLGVLAQTKRAGLKELMKIAQISPQVIQPSMSGEAPQTSLNEQTIGFVLGPRLNAAGRMDHANRAFHLLIAKTEKRAKRLAQEIDKNNSMRQKATDKIMQEVKNRLKEKFDNKKLPDIIFEGAKDWQVGLLGLVSGKLKDELYRPIVLYQERDGLALASCRSIAQFSIFEALKKHSHLFDDFGGHAQAAGFRTSIDKISEIKERITEEASENLKDKDLKPILSIDAELFLEDVSFENHNWIQKFSPFGKLNPEPIFLAKNLEVSGLRLVGNGSKHLKLELLMFNDESKQVKRFNAIGFGLGEWENKLKKGNLIDVAFRMIINEWKGFRNLEMKIVDIKLA